MAGAFEKKWQIFILVSTSIFMSTLDSSIVNVALPFMMIDLKTHMMTIQWVVLSYLVTVSALLLSFGRLSDIKGRRPVYVTGFLVFTAGSCLCAMAGDVYFLIFSRSIQGVGAAMLMACSPALLVDAFPAEERGKALGMIGSVVAAGLTIGPVIGGGILEYLSWRYIFYINIPIGIAAVVGGTVVFEESSKGSNEPMDIKGSLFLILMLSGYILFMTRMPHWGLLSLPSVSTAAVFMLAGFGFIRNESRAPFPLFDLQLLNIRLFLFPVMGAALLFAALFVIVFLMPFYLAYPCGFPASKTGAVMIVPFLFLLVISPVSGLLYNRFGSRRLCLIGMTMLLISLVSLMSAHPSQGLFSLLWRMGLAGIGTALYVSPNNTVIMGAVPARRRGIASGAVATARNIGMVTGVALAGLIFSTLFSSLSHGASLENYMPEMEPAFLMAFRRALIPGLVLSFIGICITFVRGGESDLP